MYELTIVTEKGFPGHAYLLLSKPDAQAQTRIEFGSVLAGEKYGKLSNHFSKAASILGYAVGICTYAIMPLIATGVAGGSSGLGLTLSMASLAYAAIYTPTYGRVNVQQQSKENITPEKSHQTFLISDEQADTILKEASSQKTSFYNLGAFNCVGFCKKMLNSIGIDMKANIINSPSHFSRKIQSISPIAQPKMR